MPVITVICGNGLALFKAGGLINCNDWPRRLVSTDPSLDVGGYFLVALMFLGMGVVGKEI